MKKRQAVKFSRVDAKRKCRVGRHVSEQLRFILSGKRRRQKNKAENGKKFFMILFPYSLSVSSFGAMKNGFPSGSCRR